MNATLFDNTLGQTHKLEVTSVEQAVSMMMDICRLSWNPQEEGQWGTLTKLNIARLDNHETAVSATAYYEGNEQRYFMTVRP